MRWNFLIIERRDEPCWTMHFLTRHRVKVGEKRGVAWRGQALPGLHGKSRMAMIDVDDELELEVASATLLVHGDPRPRSASADRAIVL